MDKAEDKAAPGHLIRALANSGHDTEVALCDLMDYSADAYVAKIVVEIHKAKDEERRSGTVGEYVIADHDVRHGSRYADYCIHALHSDGPEELACAICTIQNREGPSAVTT